MRTVAVWGVVVIVVCACAAGLHFVTRETHTQIGAASPWRAVQHHNLAMTVVQEFGPWRVACKGGIPKPTPRFGVIQNFGMTEQPSLDMPANMCHVDIVMRNRLDWKQILDFDLRYGPGGSVLIATLAYPPFDEQGDVVGVRLSGKTAKMATALCRFGRCVATGRFVDSDAANFAATRELAFIFAHGGAGVPREAEVPVQGLGPALSALRKIQNP